MPKDTSRHDLSLPFPGVHGPDGFATQYIRLDCCTNPELSEYCKTFKLPHSGNKTVLTDRLTAFSSDKSRWQSLLPGATNSHKGSRKSETKGKPKTSTLRRENLFEGAVAVRTPNAPVTERSKDLRTAEEKAAILPWAKRITSKYPYQPNNAQFDGNASMYINPPISAIPGLQTAVVQPDSVNANPSENTNALRLFSELLSYMQQQNPVTSSSDLPSTVNAMNTEPAATILATSGEVPSTSTWESGSTASLARENPSTADVTKSMSGNDEAPTRTLKMASGKVVTFRESAIPDPPAVSYAKSVEDLLLVWDDNSPQWRGVSPLKINDIPIPIVYWPTVYKYWKGTQWKGVKKVWFDWKILVRAMSHTTIEDFWARFSTPDKHGQLQRMKYTRILEALAKERKAENAQLADLARMELTAEQLTYRKGSQRYLMTKDSMIAAYYRIFKGFDSGGSDDEDDE
ncbi:hypothetical protein B0H17DRAFT_985676 [Mycena rosella]|uniref:SAP domain-containing protein n=1 Tax=Mycena rosella TaxID=1033263 RepID=A0AAD7D8H7_MYCRO|nr:hypothetical protein B0H17DRAFT_985676 [Mycena rosella]